ncbi:DUF11 domain-containing protein, partial [Patescibacteria group bacterium]|nr:DUF11 domain-containing protein [Patescibacteria group bacterium]
MAKRRKKSQPKKKSRAIKLIIVILVVLMLATLAGAWWMFFKRTPSFTGDNVSLNLTGPAESQVGELVTYTITYANNESTALENVELSLIYPAGFSFSVASQSASNFGDNKWQLGTLAVGQSGSLSIKGNLFGNAGVEQTAAASLTYQPASVNSTFSEHVQTKTKVNNLDVSLEAKVPASVQKESEFEFPIVVKNTTQSDLTNVRIKVNWPDKFALVSTVPAPKASNTWDLAKLKVGESETIKVKGKITDEVGKSDKVKVQVGLFDEQDNFYLQKEQEKAIKVVDISGELKLLVNNSENLNANPGDSLDIIVSYKNTGTESLHNASVVLELANSDLLDSASVEVGQGGSYKD